MYAYVQNKLNIKALQVCNQKKHFPSCRIREIGICYEFFV